MSENQFQLTVQKGPQPGKVYLLLTDAVTIGRDPMADISLNDPEVSRQHLRLTRTASGYVVEDMGSTNGTFIDGEKLDADTPLSLTDGQTISMGSGVTVLYQTPAPEEPAASEPVWADESFDAFAPDLYEPEELETAVPEFAHTPPLSEQAAPAVPSASKTPLVPSGGGEHQQKRRRNITIAVVSLILLCCCCLLFVLSAYFYWGDPLMKWLGLY